MKFLLAGAAAGFLLGLVLLSLGGTTYSVMWVSLTGLYLPYSNYAALVTPALAGAVIAFAFIRR
jgi:Na+/pantothenate symporter